MALKRVGINLDQLIVNSNKYVKNYDQIKWTNQEEGLEKKIMPDGKILYRKKRDERNRAEIQEATTR